MEFADDFACIDACLNGRPEAFRHLVEKHQDAVFGMVSRMIGDRETSLDLSQEAFLRAYRGLAAFERDASFSTWLLRIAINLCRTERRRIARRRRVGGVPRGSGAADEEREIPEPEDRRPGPAQTAEAGERRALLAEALRRMRRRSREILVLRDFEGRCYREIAGILGCPVGTVRSRLFRARCELRDLLEGALGGGGR